MARQRKTTNGNIGVGMSAKQMRRKKPINTDSMVDISPLTDNQKLFFEEYAKGKNIFAYGEQIITELLLELKDETVSVSLIENSCFKS